MNDGRTTDAGPWVYYKLTYEPGELKMAVHFLLKYSMNTLTAGQAATENVMNQTKPIGTVLIVPLAIRVHLKKINDPAMT